MTAIFSLAIELVAVALVFAATNLATLALRNPHRTGPLKRSGIGELITGVSILAILMSLSYFGYGLFTLFPGLLTGGTLFVATTVVLYLGIDRAMGMTARLKACDEGRSPFAAAKIPPGGTPA